MERSERIPTTAATAASPALDEVQRAIARLDREDRAMLRPWVLAHYDVRGYPASGAVLPVAPANDSVRPG
jgi:hypothetical protein